MTAINHKLNRGLTTLLLVLLSVSLCPATETGRILVNVEGIKPEQGGNLAFALFDAEGSWPKHNSALKRGIVPVSATTMQLEFNSVPLNNLYAVQVIHDKNGNNKLDFRWFPYPKPKEGVGVSNNNRRIGPPLYEKALFQADDSTTSIRVRLNY